MKDLTRETLRAELNNLELRLVDRISGAMALKADSSEVRQHDARIASLEQSRALREHLAVDVLELQKRVERNDRFRYAIPSASVLGLLVALGTVLLSLHH